MATTEREIRNRMIAVILALEPSKLAGERFRPFRNEDEADYKRFCKANATSCRRLVQVRTTGADEPPISSSLDIEERKVVITIMVAYPQDARAGADQALARDDVAELDRVQIDKATGRLGRANFFDPHPNACWLETRFSDRISEDGIDFLAMTHTLFYVRQL